MHRLFVIGADNPKGGVTQDLGGFAGSAIACATTG
jgi:hypothetical protein